MARWRRAAGFWDQKSCMRALSALDEFDAMVVEMPPQLFNL